MSDNNTNVPKIRFPGFTDAWEKQELGDVAEFFNEKRIPIDSGQRKNGEYPYYGATGIIDYVDGYIFNGEYVLLAEDGANITMRNSPIAYLTEGKFWLNNHAHIMRMKDGSNKFLLQLLENQNYEKYNSGTAQPKLNGQIVKKLTLSFPRKDEQTKIGSFFSELGNLIILHQRKLNNLQQQKQSLLQKMFPKNRADIPEIRFPGFTDAWEQRKVKDICSISTGKSNTQDRIDGGEYPLYVRSPIIERSNRYLYDEEAVLTVGDGVGTGKVFHYVNGKYDLHQRVYRMFGFTDKVIGKYFYHSFSNDFYERVMSMTAKTSVDSVRYDMISEMKIWLPTLDEQKKITAVFDNLDQLITLHQRKLNHLQEQKKSLLQQMFV